MSNLVQKILSLKDNSYWCLTSSSITSHVVDDGQIRVAKMCDDLPKNKKLTKPYHPNIPDYISFQIGECIPSQVPS